MFWAFFLLPGSLVYNEVPLADNTLVPNFNFNCQFFRSKLDNNKKQFFELIRWGSNFRIQGEETISSNFIFVRARNSEFNYTTNPSITTGSGELIHNVLIDSPQTFVTAVGLYNDNNELLAVAKLSRPLLKDFTKESLIRIKLDY